MKLRHKIAVILGIPAIMQLAFTVLLLDSEAKVESAAKAEAFSKQVMSAAQEVRTEIVQYVSIVIGRQFLNPTGALKLRKRIQASVKEKINILFELLKNDVASKPIMIEYSNEIKRFENIISEPGVTTDGEVFLTTYILESEFIEELLSTMNNIGRIENRLVSRFRPVDINLTPESVKARENLHNLTTFAAIADLLIVALLFGLTVRSALHRGDLLMKNIERFSSGKSELQAVGGNDELTELDTSFRSMADARFKADEERQKAEELRRSLVAMVSHDIRTPLTSVGLNLSMIMEMYSETLVPKVREKIRKTEAEITRLLRLADGLLEIEKIEDGSIELDRKWIDVPALVETATHSVIGIADSKKITVDFIDEAEFDVNCDPDRIIQVLVNLLSNAIKFSPSDSTLAIKVTQKAGIETRFEVIDQGPGIDEVDQKKLFLKFQQLDQVQAIKKTGSGLGLYITRMLVEVHGGEIGYRRTETGGSCFWFLLIQNP
ncbi:MAG: ATP-binding protein [Candidatus Melainabacteria bacterium]|nr:ATP-binding protein [Candidatus Melainabacteria bacterium]